MGLSPGSRLGPYEVVAQIGVGGMGEVYRARDGRLQREVAIKVLPEAFALDADRLARFEREARSLASLNHQNIAAIYGLEDADGVRALVMELVEGPTLADLIARGPIPIADALPIARQMAEALEAAHEQGVIHRDIKPANIKVRDDATVKVLDFGLAKAMEPTQGVSPSHSMSPTITSPVMTQAGVILGTAAYMSPEQARGQAIDKRTDIWAFGCVLYEMLTGRRPFAGETVSDLIAAIFEREPDWELLPDGVPPSVGTLLKRCLDRNVKRRLRDIGDARLEIDDAISKRLSAAADSGTVSKTLDVSAPDGRRREQVAWLAAAVSFVAAIVTAALLWWRAVPEPPPLRLEIATPQTVAPASFALSPDGRDVVFVATAGGASTLWRRPLDQTTPQPLAGTEGASNPFWAPDGRSIGFFADGKLKRLELSGGPPQQLADAVNNRGGTWSRDGVILFTPTVGGGLWRVSATGGSQAVRQGGAANARFPAFLADGHRFLFFVGPTTPDLQGIYLGSLDAPDTHRLTPADAAGAYVVPGYLLVLRQGVLVALPFDATRGAIVGEPAPIAQAVGVDSGFFRSAFSASLTGLLAYRTVTERRQLVWIDRRGTVTGSLGAPDDTNLLYPELAADGRQVAIQRFMQGNFDLWLIDVARGVWSPFTSHPGVDRATVWAPDGSRLVFSSDRNGVYDLLEKAAGGTGDERPFLTSSTSKLPADWSRDGHLLYVDGSADTGRDLWAMPPDKARQSFPVVRTRFNEDEGQFSPDGRWIAYTSDESRREEIYLAPFPTGNRIQVSKEGGGQPRWRRDGKELFYIARDGTLMAVPIDLPAAGQTPTVGAALSLFSTRLASRGARKQQYAVAADGQRFLMVVADEAAASPITIAQNWMAMLKN
jgi:Tol biopolymer transport system component